MPPCCSPYSIMIPDEFRRLALGFPGAVESAHMSHPDFRIHGGIFATLGYPDEGWGMVNLTPAQQQSWMRKAPLVFAPCAGAWGRGGATSVRLAGATKAGVRATLAAAFRNVAAGPKRGRI